METKMVWCEQCQAHKMFAEDAVADSESATVWHCLTCGYEIRPDEETSGGTLKNSHVPPNKPLVGVNR